MKYSVAAAAAVLATGALARPSFTNSVINPKEGEPFKLTFDGCKEGCTITLQHGPDSNHLNDIRTLTTDATSSYEVTLNNLGSGTYSFKIKNNEDGSIPNYSTQFQYTGTGPTSFGSTTASATSTGSSASSTDSSSTDSSSTDSSSTDSSSTTGSSSSASSTDSSTTDSSSSTSATSTSSQTSSSTSSARPSATTPPSAGSVASLSPLGLIGAAAAALFL